MKSGSKRFWTSVITGVLALALAVVVIPMLSKIKTFKDLTEDQRFTLPVEAKRIAERLDDGFVVRVYLSSTMPSFLRHLPRALRARLQEFRDASRGKLSFEFVNPDEWSADDERLQRLAQNGIQPVPIRDSEDGKITQGSYWLSLEFNYRDKREVLPLAQLGTGILLDETEVLRTLPFILGSRIVKLTSPDTTLGIVAKRFQMPRDPRDPNRPTETDGLEQLRQQLSNTVPNIVDLALKDGASIGENVQAILVHRPEQLDVDAMRKIDQFLLRGGNVVVLLDNFETVDFLTRPADWQAAFQRTPGRLNVRAIDRGEMDRWLLSHGIKVEAGFLESLDPERVSVASLEQVMDPRFGRPVTTIVQKVREHPLILMPSERAPEGKTEGDFDVDNPWFAGLGKVGLLGAVPMQVQRGEPASALFEDTKIEVLVQTPTEVLARPLEEGSVPLYRFVDKAAEKKTESGQRYPLVLSVSGRFRATFEAGASQPAGGENPDEPGETTASSTDHLSESAKPGRLVVVADSDFATQFGLIALGANPQAVQMNLGSQNGMTTMMAMQVGVVRALDSLLLGEDLAAMRRPRLAKRIVDQAKIEEDKGAIRRTVLGLPAVLLVGLGLAAWVMRSLTTGSKSSSGPRRPAEASMTSETKGEPSS